MSQAYNLGKFANTLNTSGQIDVTIGISGTFPTTNLPTIPINKGGTNLTTVGANGTIVSTDGSAYIYGSASGALTWDTVKTSSFTAVAGYGYLVNTTSSTITVTLPSSPSVGQSVVVVDYAGTAETNNIIINGGGSLINNSGAKLIQTNRTGLTFVYIDSTQGWLAQSNVYSGNPPFANAPISISYLVVAGGGGAGTTRGGGGGAGGYLASTATLTGGSTYTVTVGSGGSVNTSGSNSVLSGTGITTVTSVGGGRGGTYPDGAGLSGGSGGGGSYRFGAGGSGTSGQGNAGGTGTASAGSPGFASCGGGGAGAAGATSTASNGGAGGVGLTSSITGSSIYYAGGGGGASDVTPGAGGLGGGGSGTSTTNGVDGTANTGGGGGGSATATGAAGGSGVVILSIPTNVYSGISTGSPTITTSGSNTILKFTASGTYTA